MHHRFVALLHSDDPAVAQTDGCGFRAALQQFPDCLARRDGIVYNHPGDRLRFFAIDFHEANNNRIVNVPGAYEVDRINDRRPELYSVISERGQAVAKATG